MKIVIIKEDFFQLYCLYIFVPSSAILNKITKTIIFITRFIKYAEFGKHFHDNWNTCAPVNFLGKESDLITKEDIEYVTHLADSYQDLTALFTDAMFALSSDKVAEHLVQRNSHVFKYIFSYRGQSKAQGFGSPIKTAELPL